MAKVKKTPTVRPAFLGKKDVQHKLHTIQSFKDTKNPSGYAATGVHLY